MIARVCAAQMARTIVRALHVAPADQSPSEVVSTLYAQRSTPYAENVGRREDAPAPRPQ